MTNQAVNLSPLFNSIASFYKVQEKAYSNFLNYSSTMQSGFAEEERIKAILATEATISSAHDSLEPIASELKKESLSGEHISALMAQAINTSFKAESDQGFSEAQNLDFNTEAQDLNLYHAADIFVGLLVCLDKIFTMSISLKEMYPEPDGLRPKAIRDLQQGIDSLMFKMENTFKPITSALKPTALDNIEESLISRPSLMNRNKIDSVGSVIRFLHRAQDSL